MIERDAALVLEELRAVGTQLRDLDHRRTQLYERRTALFLEGRAFDPPIMLRELGEAALVGELAVGVALRKYERDHGGPT